MLLLFLVTISFQSVHKIPHIRIEFKKVDRFQKSKVQIYLQHISNQIVTFCIEASEADFKPNTIIFPNIAEQFQIVVESCTFPG